MRTWGIRTLVITALVAVVLTGCSSKKSSNKTTTTTSAYGQTTAPKTTTSSATTKASVDTATNSLGTILVDSKGDTLYLYDNDTTGVSNCIGDCAASWPPLTGASTVGRGLDATKITAITRSDGTKQLAYNGHPLYTWVGDAKAGDTTGQGVSSFYVISADGNKINND